MRRALLVTVLALFAAPALADPLIGPLQPLPPGEYIYWGMSAADTSLSLDIKNHPGLSEGNPLLGRHPTDAQLIGFHLATDAIHALITEEMEMHHVPRPFIKMWELVSVGTEGAVITKGALLGLHFTW